MTLLSDPAAPVDSGRWLVYVAIVIAVVVVAGSLVYLVATRPSPTTPPTPATIRSDASVQCAAAPCSDSIGVTAGSLLFLGFGYSVAQSTVAPIGLAGYPFLVGNEFTKQNFGSPSVQAGFYYWTIDATANVTVYLNYSTPAVADLSLEDFTGVQVAGLPSEFVMGDGSGTSVGPSTADYCELGSTFEADETVVLVTMAGAYESSPPTPESSPYLGAVLPGEVSTESGALVGEFGALAGSGPANLTATLAEATPFATVCLGLLPG